MKFSGNLYATLGVTHDVTPQVARIAFEGKLLVQAYATLSNPAKKDWYDKSVDEARRAQSLESLGDRPLSQNPGVCPLRELSCERQVSWYSQSSRCSARRRASARQRHLMR